MTDGWVLVPRERLSRWADICTENDLIMIADEMYSALAAAPPVDGWQPIETAPRDETKVLLWSDGGAVFGSWRVDEGYASKKPMWLDESYDDFSGGFASVPLDPTHWMPLPQPHNNERTR